MPEVLRSSLSAGEVWLGGGAGSEAASCAVGTEILAEELPAG